MKKPKVIAIVGPTASGKSALAVDLAKKFDGEIISADSRQVYRGLNIGTGKVTKKEMAGVPHHLLDVADPKQQYDVNRFVRDGRKAIEQILNKGKLPIICGGTGFYVSMLLGEISTPNVPPNRELRKKLGGKTAKALHTMLRKLDPARAQTIDPHNKVRLVRSIEIAKAIGKMPNTQKIRLYTVLKIGTQFPEKKLYERIHDRLLARIKQGMVAEAKKLRRSGLSLARMDALGLEYRFLGKYLSGELTQKEMVEKLDIEIRHYAKRQMRWFKRDQEIKWVSPSTTSAINRMVKKFLD